MPTAPARSFVPVAPRISASASTPRSGMAIGIRLSRTFTTPPIAPPPYNNAAGPRSTSIRCASNGSVVTAWSGEIVDASISSEPSASTLTRGAVWPRITGRLAPPPNVSECMPGKPFNVSPNVPWRRVISSSSSSTSAGNAMLLISRPRGFAETVIGARVSVVSVTSALGTDCAYTTGATAIDNARASGRGFTFISNPLCYIVSLIQE